MKNVDHGSACSFISLFNSYFFLLKSLIYTCTQAVNMNSSDTKFWPLQSSVEFKYLTSCLILLCKCFLIYSFNWLTHRFCASVQILLHTDLLHRQLFTCSSLLSTHKTKSYDCPIAGLFMWDIVARKSNWTFLKCCIYEYMCLKIWPAHFLSHSNV